MQSFLYTPVSDIRDVGLAYDDVDANPEDPTPIPPPNAEDAPQEPRPDVGVEDIDEEPQFNIAATPEPAIC